MEQVVQVPELGESITEATVSAWLKEAGETVADGDILVELETDKVMVEVPAVQAGVLTEILKQAGEKVTVGEGLCRIDSDGKGVKSPAKGQAAPAVAPPKEAPAAAAASPAPPLTGEGLAHDDLPPAVRRMVEENRLDPAQIKGSGKHGQITKGDVVQFLESKGATAPPPLTPPKGPGPALASASASAAAPAPAPAPAPRASGERQERVPMSRLRQRIAERLLQAQQTAAILTTFNEVDMGAAMELRTRYKEAFREKYGVAIGFMSFFTKACIEALKAFPAVNAEIDGEEIVYKHHYDIGVAVGTEKGLVVPVVRDADQMRFIEIELAIAELAKKARENKLTVQDLTGGTFTISNGGIYGSMLSTPILNPPQSGILGMHNIIQRPVVHNGEIVARPMMFLALSYDHRIIDGREAVQFLIKVKECIEDPARMLLEI